MSAERAEIIILRAENAELRDRWRECVDTIDVLRSALHHRGVWSGTECMCDQDPCPGFPDV